MKKQAKTHYFSVARTIVCTFLLLSTSQLKAQETDYSMYIYLKSDDLIKVGDGVYKVPVNSVEKIDFKDESSETHSDTYLSCPDGNHPHAIDLGLPSGTKWACCNVGASSPEQYGGYYAWGETSEKSYYDPSTYQFSYIDDNGWYDSRTGKSYSYSHIGSDIAGTAYDVVHVKWGGSWVMPSRAQIEELVNNCSYAWTNENGVYGGNFTGPNGGTVFLPAAGRRWYDELSSAGDWGLYWSSSLDGSSEYLAYVLDFSSGYAYWGNSNRCYGLSVRPVRRN